MRQTNHFCLHKYHNPYWMEPPWVNNGTNLFPSQLTSSVVREEMLGMLYLVLSSRMELAQTALTSCIALKQQSCPSA